MSIRFALLFIGIIFLVGSEGKPLPTEKLNNRINYLLNITEFKMDWNETIDTLFGDKPNAFLMDKSMMDLKSKLKTFLNQFLPYESLRPHLVKIYGDLYTSLDINKLIRFYLSPTGKKTIDNEITGARQFLDSVADQLVIQMPEIRAWITETFDADFFSRVADRLRILAKFIEELKPAREIEDDVFYPDAE